MIVAMRPEMVIATRKQRVAKSCIEARVYCIDRERVMGCKIGGEAVSVRDVRKERTENLAGAATGKGGAARQRSGRLTAMHCVGDGRCLSRGWMVRARRLGERMEKMKSSSKQPIQRAEQR